MSNAVTHSAETESRFDHCQTTHGKLRFYGDGFVFDPMWGMFYRISPAGAFVLRTVEAGVSRDDLPDLLGRQYGLSQTRAVRDVEMFLNDLSVLGLIDEPAP